MKTEDYKIGDRVYSPEAHCMRGYGVVVKKDVILGVKWDKVVYDEYIKYTPENGLTVRLADPYIREEKLNSLGIWG